MSATATISAGLCEFSDLPSFCCHHCLTAPVVVVPVAPRVHRSLGTGKQPLVDALCDLIGRPRAIVPQGGEQASLIIDVARRVGVLGVSSRLLAARAVIEASGRRFDGLCHTARRDGRAGDLLTVEGLARFLAAARSLTNGLGA